MNTAASSTVSRPAALAHLKESPQPLVSDGTSWCAFHGYQDGLNCPSCDEHFPEQVKARSVPGVQATVPADIQAMVDAAVKQAVGEALAFERWKNSKAGQAAAKEAATGKVKKVLHPATLTANPDQVLTPAAPKPRKRAKR